MTYEPGVDELLHSDSPLVTPHATRNRTNAPRFSKFWFPGSVAVEGGFIRPVGGGLDSKISALTAATSFLDADEFPVNEAGTTKKVTGTLLKAWAGSVLTNQSTADQAPAAATLTYLTNSSISVPTGKLRIGTRFQWQLVGTKSAAGTTTGRAFHVRIGTAGTTADTAVLTFTSAGTPAATVDTGVWFITVTIRGPLSASCIAAGFMSLNRGIGTAAAGGLLASGVNTENLQVTSSAFDATVASLIVGLTVTTATAEVITFQEVVAQAVNL